MTDDALRADILARAVASLGALDGVEAIYLSGSLAEQTADRYSDIDLRVVAADDAYESVRARREALPPTWGPFLFHQTVGEIHTVTYYESLTKADVFYFSAGALIPSPWFNLGTRILLDRRGQLASLLAASKDLPFTAGAHEVAGHLGTCVAGLAEGAKRVRRGESIYATRLCAEAVHHLLAVDDLLSRRAPFGSSKRERRAPGPLTELARSSLAAPSPADAPAYFTALAAALRPLLSLAEGQGHCSGAAAARLRTALDQLPDLAADA